MWGDHQLELDRFCERLLQILEIEAGSRFGPLDNLYETVGLDSFQAFQMIIVIESLAGADVPPVELPEMYTLQDAYQYYLVLKELDPAIGTL